jgi:hypothetical protein
MPRRALRALLGRRPPALSNLLLIRLPPESYTQEETARQLDEIEPRRRSNCVRPGQLKSPGAPRYRR